MKKLLSIVFTICLLFSVVTSAIAAAPILVLIDGSLQNFSIDPNFALLGDYYFHSQTF